MLFCNLQSLTKIVYNAYMYQLIVWKFQDCSEKKIILDEGLTISITSCVFLGKIVPLLLLPNIQYSPILFQVFNPLTNYLQTIIWVLGFHQLPKILTP